MTHTFYIAFSFPLAGVVNAGRAPPAVLGPIGRDISVINKVDLLHTWIVSLTKTDFLPSMPRGTYMGPDPIWAHLILQATKE